MLAAIGQAMTDEEAERILWAGMVSFWLRFALVLLILAALAWPFRRQLAAAFDRFAEWFGGPIEEEEPDDELARFGLDRPLDREPWR